MTLLEFQTKYAEEILKILPRPEWVPELDDFNKKTLEVSAQKYGRRAFASQMEFVVTPILYNFLKKDEKVGIINAEMGTGKTTMSNIVAYNLFKEKYQEKGMRILFLTSGAKHLKKMRREAEAVFGENVKISFYTIKTKPRKREKEEITLEEALEIKPQPGEVVYFLLSKDTGKFDIKYEDISEKLKKCPDCGHKFELNKNKKRKIKSIFCPSCGTKLIKPVKGKLGFAEKIEKKARYKTHKFWDLAIVDEVHEFQNPLSLQSRLYKAIIKHSYYKIVMTGTLSNGYASSIFHILYPLIPNHFKKYGFDYKKIGAFIDYFGSKKESRTIKLIGKRGRQTVKIEELPRINDKIIGFLAPYTVWFEIKDLDVEMPPLKEFLEIVPLDSEIEQRYKEFERAIKNTGNSMFLEPKNQVRSAIASFVYRLNNHTYPHSFTLKGYDIGILPSGEIVPDGSYQEIPIHFNPLPEDFISMKEKKLIEVVSKELKEGRRVIIYGVYNHATKLYDRLVNVLAMHGIDADYMPDSVKAEDIEEWINNYKKDVVILPQKRVATGLDLVQFHTIVFYELDRQLRIVSQAKQRPWRPVGQEKEVRVYYLAYQGIQERELKLMAEKMRAAATVEGRIIEDDSIAAIYDYNPEVSEAIKEISDKIQYVDSEIVRSKEENKFAEYYIQKMKEFDSKNNKNAEDISESADAELETEIDEAVETESASNKERIISVESVKQEETEKTENEKVLALQSVMEDMNPPADSFTPDINLTSIPELVATLEAMAQGNIPVELLQKTEKIEENTKISGEKSVESVEDEIKMDIDEKGQMYFVFD